MFYLYFSWCRLGRGVFTIGEDTHILRLKSELFDLRVGYANPILRLGESQRGVRILSKRKRGMLLGVRFVKTVPLRYKFKPTSPRDADTANTLCLMVCCVPAGFDSRCCSVTLEGKQHSVVF